MNPADAIAVIGGGPAGLAAAYELARHGRPPMVFEKHGILGGLARTERYKGYRFDIGGHRFFTGHPRIRALWDEVIGEDFRKVPRVSHIYYQRRFFNYPLEPFNALRNLGLWESTRVLLSYLRARLRPYPDESTLDRWVSNRFGRRLFEIFFASYTEKVWGIPCHEIQSEWAAQRIQGMSLRTAVVNALLGTNSAKSLIRTFDYPVLGPGMMWERMAATIERRGGSVTTGAAVTGLRWAERSVHEVEVAAGDGRRSLPVGQVITSVPLNQLVGMFQPAAPEDVTSAARELEYRGFILVGLIVDRRLTLPDNWIYIHSPEVRAGRVQIFHNWSPAMVPDDNRSSLGVEYFCSVGDAIWALSDSDLIATARSELVQLGLVKEGEVRDGVVFRHGHAYPVYNARYRENRERVRRFLSDFDNLQTIGRNGLHRYNNMDHSMWTGLVAADSILGVRTDLWVDSEWSSDESAAAPYA